MIYIYLFFIIFNTNAMLKANEVTQSDSNSQNLSKLLTEISQQQNVNYFENSESHNSSNKSDSISYQDNSSTITHTQHSNPVDSDFEDLTNKILDDGGSTDQIIEIIIKIKNNPKLANSENLKKLENNQNHKSAIIQLQIIDILQIKKDHNDLLYLIIKAIEENEKLIQILDKDPTVTQHLIQLTKLERRKFGLKKTTDNENAIIKSYERVIDHVIKNNLISQNAQDFFFVIYEAYEIYKIQPGNYNLFITNIENIKISLKVMCDNFLKENKFENAICYLIKFYDILKYIHNSDQILFANSYSFFRIMNNDVLTKMYHQYINDKKEYTRLLKQLIISTLHLDIVNLSKIKEVLSIVQSNSNHYDITRIVFNRNTKEGLVKKIKKIDNSLDKKLINRLLNGDTVHAVALSLTNNTRSNSNNDSNNNFRNDGDDDDTYSSTARHKLKYRNNNSSAKVTTQEDKTVFNQSYVTNNNAAVCSDSNTKDDNLTTNFSETFDLISEERIDELLKITMQKTNKNQTITEKELHSLKNYIDAYSSVITRLKIVDILFAYNEVSRSKLLIHINEVIQEYEERINQSSPNEVNETIKTLIEIAKLKNRIFFLSKQSETNRQDLIQIFKKIIDYISENNKINEHFQNFIFYIYELHKMRNSFDEYEDIIIKNIENIKLAIIATCDYLVKQENFNDALGYCIKLNEILKSTNKSLPSWYTFQRETTHKIINVMYDKYINDSTNYIQLLKYLVEQLLYFSINNHARNFINKIEEILRAVNSNPNHYLKAKIEFPNKNIENLNQIITNKINISYVNISHVDMFLDLINGKIVHEIAADFVSNKYSTQKAAQSNNSNAAQSNFYNSADQYPQPASYQPNSSYTPNNPYFAFQHQHQNQNYYSNYYQSSYQPPHPSYYYYPSYHSQNHYNLGQHQPFYPPNHYNLGQPDFYNSHHYQHNNYAYYPNSRPQ